MSQPQPQLQPQPHEPPHTPTSSSAQSAKYLIAQLSTLDADALGHNQEERFKALELSKRLVAELEGPVNRATELVFKPFSSIAARIAVGLNLFEHIVARGDASISTQELADVTGGEVMLISRILRILASISFVTQTSPSTWRANSTTIAMATAPIAAGHRFVFDALITSAIKAPKYLAETGYKLPKEPNDGFVQYANQTKLHIFDFLASQPRLFSDFNLFMGSTMGAREYWCEWFDVQGRILEGFEAGEGRPLLVDVGGGKGHDLQVFWERFCRDEEGMRGELVLQELGSVIEGIREEELDGSVKRMEYDFFMEQPVKGARAYFMHHILHDWSDKYCHRILKQLHDAMTPGYSRLLIHDLILPDVGAAEFQARFDLTMMTFNSGMERSREEWTKLLEDAGFRVLGLWEHLDADGIIEAEVAA